jgi:hypothetical protein
MSRLWLLSAGSAELRGVRSPPWHCQLVHTETTNHALVLDLVALESCPSDAVGCPRGTPFSLHLGRDATIDRSWDRTLAAWAESADIVVIVSGATDGGTPWLCLSSADRHLVLQL